MTKVHLQSIKYRYLYMYMEISPIKSEASKSTLKLDNQHSMVEFNKELATIRHYESVGSLIDVQTTLENISAVNKLTENKNSPLLIDLTAFTKVNPLYTPTARTVLLGSEFTQRRSAIAFLFHSEEQKKMSSHFHTANKFNIPLKGFSNREEAILWLKTFILN